jgi:hypothetical protein
MNKLNAKLEVGNFIVRNRANQRGYTMGGLTSRKICLGNL